MPIPTLSWNLNAEYVIPVAGTDATYLEFLNTLVTVFNASTYWKVTGSNFDAVNLRGYVEVAPKDVTAGITEGRFILCYCANGTVSASRINASWVNAPFAAAAGTNCSRAWFAFSPNAATTGPVNDPYGGTDPYAGKTYSKFWPLGSSRVPPGSIMGLIESNEGFCLYWSVFSDASGNWGIQPVMFGKMVANPDGNTSEFCAFWSISLWSTTYSTQNGWFVTGNNWADGSQNGSGAYPGPMPLAYRSHSAGLTAAAGPCSYGAMQKTDGSLFGIGRVGEGDTFANQATSLVTAATTVMGLHPIALGGGLYAGGAQSAFLGYLRQIRRGPTGKRGQKFFDGASVKQTTYLTFDSQTSYPNGLHFDQFQ